MCSSLRMMTLLLLSVLGLSVCQAEERIYRMCVPKIYYEDCLTLLKDPSEAGIQMQCVAGRDRIECLDMINQRKADVLASEPEDMYVAYHKKNQDYRVISEIRTKEDKNAEFRYEGIILVKKGSNIKSLKDLKGAKSCHTGFGRNVGFKIPITKLKNAEILKVSMEPDVSATERELKALSEFFSKSCLVGTYSHNLETDVMLKKKYSNLCALCEKPAQCNYPDKYSGYDGAIRCLHKGEGEVAFTKVQFVKKYFGLIEGTTAEGNPNDVEYLCEDGTRRPVTGPACSWAQRPWMGYISNTDTVKSDEGLHSLQSRLEKFFANGLHAQNKDAAAHLLINDNAVYHNKVTPVEPKEYLERAGYKDVIERDGSMVRKMKFCVQTEIEMSKCEAMRQAAYSRDIRPAMECMQDANCMEQVKQGKADMMAARGPMYKTARAAKLMPVTYEHYGENNYYVAVVDPTVKTDALRTLPVYFDASNERARIAAAFLNKQRGITTCQPSSERQLQIVNSRDLEQYKDRQLLCPNMEKKPATEWRTCNFEANLPVAVFIRDSMTPIEQDTLKNMFSALSAKFGKGSKTADVFALFGEFAKDQHNVIFSDEAEGFKSDLQNDITMEHIYDELKCKTNEISKN